MSKQRFIKPFNIRVSPDMAEEITAVAKAEETSASNLFRLAAREHLARRKAQAEKRKAAQP